ncbi:MAG: hypothetical protein HRU09_01020 [Oligoflexales bacterium]|nr:hypothetical protein [Oligoflexales bacterium]
MKFSSIAQQAIGIKSDALRVGFSEDKADALAMAYIKSHTDVSVQPSHNIDTTNKKEEEFGTPTQLGITLQQKGYSTSSLAARDVNKLLAAHGLQTKSSKGWEPTKDGKLLSKVNFMTTEVKGKVHQGPMNIRWDLDSTARKLMKL